MSIQITGSHIDAKHKNEHKEDEVEESVLKLNIGVEELKPNENEALDEEEGGCMQRNQTPDKGLFSRVLTCWCRRRG